MKYIFIIFTLITISMNTACVSSSSKIAPVVEQEKVQFPFWVDNPNLSSFNGIVGSATVQKIGGIEGQRRVAMLKARAEYSKQFKASVESTTNIIQNSEGLSSMQDQKKISAGNAISFGDAMVKEEWVHPETKELFIWVLLPKN